MSERTQHDDEEAAAAARETTPLLAARKGAATPLPKLQIAILLLLQFCEPITSQCIYPFINQLISELDITGGDERKVGYYAGLIESLFFVTEALTVLQWSRLSDHVGRKPVLLFGLTGICLSMLAFGLSRTFWGLVVSRCLAGMLNGNTGVMKSMMGELTDASNMAQGFSLIPIVWCAGASIGPFLGGTLARPHDRFPRFFGGEFWKTYPYFLPCAASAAVIAFAFIMTYFFLKETVHRRKAPEKITRCSSETPSGESGCQSPTLQRSSEDPVPLRELLVFRVLISILNYVFLAFLNIMLSALQPLFYSTPIEFGGLGLPPATIGMWLGAIGLCEGLFQVLFFAKIVRRWGPKRVFVTAMSSFLPIFALFPVISFITRRWGVSPLVWALLACQLSLSVVMDMAFGCVFMFVTSSAPNKRSLGATNGLSQTTVAIARAIGPVLATSLFAFSVEHNVMGGNGVYVVLVLLSAASLVPASRLPDQPWSSGRDV